MNARLRLRYLVAIALPVALPACAVEVDTPGGEPTESATVAPEDEVTAQAHPVVQVTRQDHGSRIELPVGHVLQIDLESNPSTGYAWQLRNAVQSNVRQIDSQWIPHAPAVLGAPGTSQLRFVGARHARATLELVYVRSWESSAPVDTFTVEVDVEGESPTLGGKPEKLPKPNPDDPPDDPPVLSDSFSWCDPLLNPQGVDACADVRDQGQCGSCWAFGTLGSIESAISIFRAQSRDLSEQELVDCIADWGCDGGWFAHEFVQLNGAQWESYYPYVSGVTTVDGEACLDTESPRDSIDGYGEVFHVPNKLPSVADLKSAISTYGPVAAAACASNWSPYEGGIYTGKRRCTVNHAIVIVGWEEYTDGSGAWIVRNSWGPGWGEDGYIRVAFGTDQIGYAAQIAEVLPLP